MVQTFERDLRNASKGALSALDSVEMKWRPLISLKRKKKKRTEVTAQSWRRRNRSDDTQKAALLHLFFRKRFQPVIYTVQMTWKKCIGDVWKHFQYYYCAIDDGGCEINVPGCPRVLRNFLGSSGTRWPMVIPHSSQSWSSLHQTNIFDQVQTYLKGQVRWTCSNTWKRSMGHKTWE